MRMGVDVPTELRRNYKKPDVSTKTNLDLIGGIWDKTSRFSPIYESPRPHFHQITSRTYHPGSSIQG